MLAVHFIYRINCNAEYSVNGVHCDSRYVSVEVLQVSRKRSIHMLGEDVLGSLCNVL